MKRHLIVGSLAIALAAAGAVRAYDKSYYKMQCGKFVNHGKSGGGIYMLTGSLPDAVSITFWTAQGGQYAGQYAKQWQLVLTTSQSKNLFGEWCVSDYWRSDNNLVGMTISTQQFGKWTEQCNIYDLKWGVGVQLSWKTDSNSKGSCKQVDESTNTPIKCAAGNFGCAQTPVTVYGAAPTWTRCGSGSSC